MNSWINIIAGSRGGAGTQNQQCGGPQQSPGEGPGDIAPESF